MESLTSKRLLDRRALLKGTGLASLAGVSWLTPLAEVLAQDADSRSGGEGAQSVILLWMGGGPSQLETFDPHPGKAIGGPTKAINTAAPGVQIAEGLPLLAQQMDSISLVRSLKSKEGDHERGTYCETGYSPDPTAIHPSIGAICCHTLPEALPSGLKTEIPRHVSILPNQWPGRGGDLGDKYDAFKTYDPSQPVPDVMARVSDERFEQRFKDLSVVEQAFASRRARQVQRTLHRHTVDRARVMMTSEQLSAFDINKESESLRENYGDSPFGRGCLAARRLIEVGVRCVEVTLNGWDTHTSNFSGCQEQNKILDPAFAALIADLKERDLLKKTLVLCGGEFGRTPIINGGDGRDHWPHSFSMAVAGGGVRGGLVIGDSDPEGGREVENPQSVPNLHATVFRALGIDYGQEYISHAQRPIKYSEGTPIKELLENA